jgi:agmatinase
MIDPDKLAAWRQKFTNDKPHQTEGEAHRKAAGLGFRANGLRNFPFAGIPTLIGAPYRPDAAEAADFGGLDVALIGVPMDLAVTNRAGCRLGPRAIRNIERIGPFHHTHGIAPLAELAAADVGDVAFRSRFSLEQSHEDIEAYFTRVAAAGVRPLAAGGDHSISYPILRAIGRDRPVGLVHIDAHCDTSGVYEGSRFHHGGPFRQAVLDGVLDPARTIQIGIRGGGEYLWEFSFETGMTVIHAEEVDALGVAAVVARARDVIGDGPVYVSFDVDAIDPAFTPGTGTPEVGGLTPREAQRILRGLAGLNVIGGDVVEVAPQYDATTVTAQVGAQMMFEIMALLALAPKAA